MACDPTEGKIRSTLEKKCSGVDLTTAVPACSTADVETAAICVDVLVEREVCPALNAANASCMA